MDERQSEITAINKLQTLALNLPEVRRQEPAQSRQRPLREGRRRRLHGNYAANPLRETENGIHERQSKKIALNKLQTLT
jgi:hypothetical protein